MRRLLNILAVLVGVLSVVLILMNAALCVWAVVYYVQSGAKLPADLPLFAVMGLGAGLCFIGWLIGSRALQHLRKPDARSAVEIMTMAIYMLLFGGILPLIKNVPYAVIPLLIALYFVRRYVLQQTARVFPPGSTASHA
jgi:hypothetical protein